MTSESGMATAGRRRSARVAGVRRAQLPPLCADEFAAVFHALHGKPPFPWQVALAARVTTEGRWPRHIDVPTGCGKTATIDIALFALSVDADRGPKRRAPVRIAMVVDRRVVVNQAYDHASMIAKKLAAARDSSKKNDVLTRFARRLAYLSDKGIPLCVRALHGGVPCESDWARTPSQPTVLCTTVDQVGSRLLFRGYGVSDSMRPVHAGLIGSDCLILLDEAHLSEPFRQTLDAIESFRKPPWCLRNPSPWGFVSLTATAGSGDSKLRVENDPPFRLTQADRCHPELSRRLKAKKQATLVITRARSTEGDLLAKELAEQAWRLSRLGGGNDGIRAVLLVVNRVRLARQCYSVLEALRPPKAADAEVVLFIGRTREVERQVLTARYRPELASDRVRPSGSKKVLFVVATQCIEAGADFDFDAMVSQCAPLDSLLQRFGRLNRNGFQKTANAVIAIAPDEIGAGAVDPVYGDRLKVTWQWLLQHAAGGFVVDFGIEAMRKRLAKVDTAGLMTEKRDAPVLMPAYLDQWMQTSPVPASDPEAALFLHGAPDGADVQIVWRADLDAQGENFAEALEVLTLMPPRTGEAVSVPIRAARSWLAGRAVVAVSDLEGAPQGDEPLLTGADRWKLGSAIRWCGAEGADTGLIDSDQLRPGDVIVVPTWYGGCDKFGWNPESRQVVCDVADSAARPYARGRFAFRIHPGLLVDELHADLGDCGVDALGRARRVWERVQSTLQRAGDELDGAVVARRLVMIKGLPDRWREALAAIASAKSVTLSFPYADEDSEAIDGAVFVCRKGVTLALNEECSENSEPPSTESDITGSFGPRRIVLDQHSADVERQVRRFALQAGLASDLAEDVALAGLLHDEGKRDIRNQAYLRNGDVLGASLDPVVLAKSERPFTSSRAEARARELAGLPARWRHEADSVRRALLDLRLRNAHDKLLVVWLIGTHHGYGRPLFPHTDAPHAGPQNIDFLIDGMDWVEIFHYLCQKYGIWELARLEGIVRLADHRVSEAEQNT